MRYQYRGMQTGNPLANVLVIVIGIVLIAASIVLGFVAFVIVGSILFVMASVVGLRVWWLNRKLGRRKPADKTDKENGGIIEGEYRVIADDRERE